MLRAILSKLPLEERFVQSIGLLALAMMSALYSSSAGRDGRVGGAAVSALAALGISIWVAYRFVPRLARQVDWQWVPLVSRYRVTYPGWIFLGGVAVVVFAAVNTSNNLLYMVLSALLAVLLLSGFLSSLNFRSLKVELSIPSRAFANDDFELSVRIHNEKRVFPTFSLHAESPELTSLRFPHLYFEIVNTQDHQRQAGTASFSRRGRYVLKGLGISSRYPFGFLAKERIYNMNAECICYPEILPQEQINISISDMQGATPRFERGFGNDLYTIREYIPSDSGRHVHWKASAKTGSLKTREYAEEESQRVVLALDRFGADGDAERFESLVSYAASLAFYLIKEEAEVALVTDEWISRRGSNDATLDSILNYLATVEMSSSAPMPDADGGSGAILLSLRERQR
jgi:uncharacterized protein (DUF58 family)